MAFSGDVSHGMPFLWYIESVYLPGFEQEWEMMRDKKTILIPY
jgi:hypothetical protein